LTSVEVGITFVLIETGRKGGVCNLEEITELTLAATPHLKMIGIVTLKRSIHFLRKLSILEGY